MSTHDHDNDALPGEDELKALYRSLPRKEPSPELDRAIKRAAAEAVRSTRRPATRWPVAVASVAMAVVAAGLGWRMLQQPSSVPQIPSASVSAKSAPAPEPVSPPAPAPEAQPAPQLATAEPAPPPPPRAQRPAASPLLPEHDNIRSAMKPKVMARVAVPPAQPAPAPPPAVVEASAPVATMRQESVSAAPPMPAPPAPPAPAAPMEQMEAAPAPIATPTPASAPSAAVMGGARYNANAMPRMAAPAPMPAPDATAPSPTDTPAQELDKIRQLLVLHRHDEAMQRLAAFRKAHPDMPLPDDLQAQLPDHE